VTSSLIAETPTLDQVLGTYAMQLGTDFVGYRNQDTTAAFSADRMHAAHELNGPTFAHDILTTEELCRGWR
jgi:hypothetical protein